MGSIRGFTLMDLLVAVAVFGIVATVAFPNFDVNTDAQNQQDPLQDAVALVDAN